MKGRKGGLSVKLRRVLALVLALLLALSLGGCAAPADAAVLCSAEAAPAGRAMAEAGAGLSYAVAEDDPAALQQLTSGQCEFALVTESGAKTWQEAGGAASPEAVLAVFAVLSRAGDYGAWDRNTRVVIVGEAGGFGDSLAQQVLTCALYGSVRYDDLDAALSALERGTADAVLGMIAPQDEGVSRALGRVRNLELLSMPESLIAVRVPDAAVREHALELGGQTAQTYALFGALCTGGAVSTEQEEAAYRAAQEAGILSVGAPGAILE